MSDLKTRAATFSHAGLMGEAVSEEQRRAGDGSVRMLKPSASVSWPPSRGQSSSASPLILLLSFLLFICDGVFTA